MSENQATHRKSGLRGRLELAGELLRRGLKSVAVEVGTHRGDFAAPFLREWPGTLACVDPWENPPGYEHQGELLRLALNGAPTREEDMAYCDKFLSEVAPGRYELVRDSSPAAAVRFDDCSLDFVYIDGDHERAAVEADLAAWWPKVRVGGILAGHDFVCNEEDGGWGRNIYPAVMEFAKARGVEPLEIVEPDGMPSSFMIVKLHRA